METGTPSISIHSYMGCPAEFPNGRDDRGKHSTRLEQCALPTAAETTWNVERERPREECHIPSSMGSKGVGQYDSTGVVT